MISKLQSLASSISAIMEWTTSQFRDKFAEWLACIEYNGLKNKGSILLSIVNPDTISKADLLHIIQLPNGLFKAVSGPNIKYGEDGYLLHQWEKIVKERSDIPMLDIQGTLTTDEGIIINIF